MSYRDSDIRGGRVLPKRSSTAGDTPAAGSLRPGEIAVNSADGVAFVGTLSGVSTIPSAIGINKIVAITQEAYDAIETKDSSTLYVIT